MADSDDLLTPADVAARLAVSVRSVRRYADSGLLATGHLGRTVRYRERDVARLVAKRHGQPAPPGGQNGQRTADTPPVATMADVTADVSAERTGEAAALAEVSAAAVAALRDELAALRAENARLQAEATAKAEAAGLWQGRARTLEEQVRQLTAGAAPTPRRYATPAPPADTSQAEDAGEVGEDPDLLWRRVWRAIKRA
jgi:uncharacterized small protein (DUF1192 family)